MKVSNKYVDDQFNNTNIHSTKFVEFCKGTTSPNCYLFVHKTRSLAVDYTDISINDVIKIEIRYQSYLDTNIQFGKSTESPGCTSLTFYRLTETRETNNFSSILSNISLGYVVNKMSTANEMCRFLNGFYDP